MGMCRRFLKPNFEMVINKLQNLNELDVIELGDHRLNRNNGYDNKVRFPPTRFRNLYKNKFHSWRVFDIQQKFNDVEYCDLSILSNEKNCADILINYGTAEHIEKESGQYNYWLNAHNFLKINGISINSNPLAGKWPNHCRWYYNFDFFKKFENYGYKILQMEITWHDNIYCRIQKIQCQDFMSYDEFMKTIIFKDTNLSKISFDNNPKKLKN